MKDLLPNPNGTDGMARDFQSLNDEGICRFYNNDSKVLLAWFGGINEPFFSETFPNLSKFNCLYFRDDAYDWYTNGLQSANISRPEFSALLKHECGRYDYVVFCGQSSGGYGALYYGLEVGASLCIVFSPQTRNFFTGPGMMVPHVKLEDIGKSYKEASRRPRVIINISRTESDHEHQFEWHDHQQVELLRSVPGVTTIIHDYNNHSVSTVMRNDGLLYKFIYSLVQTYNANTSFEELTRFIH